MILNLNGLGALRGWRRRLIAFAAGATGALALAPLNFVPAFFIPMMAAVWLIDGCEEKPRPKQTGWKAVPARGYDIRSSRPPSTSMLKNMFSAFACGWWWGFGYFVAGLWWLGAAFLVDADEFAWALPFGVFGLPALLAFFPAFGFALAKFLWRPGFAKIFALAAGLGLSEWLRGHLFTGFPWNLYGMALGGELHMAQLASLIGVYGLTLLAILIFAAPALLMDHLPGRPNFLPLVFSFAALAAIIGFGFVRLSSAKDKDVPGVYIRIMQPNQPQNAYFRPENGPAILRDYLTLSAQENPTDHQSLKAATVLIWPESAFPFILGNSQRALKNISAFLPETTTLITGAAREAPKDPFEAKRDKNSTVFDFNAVEDPITYFNSIQILAKDRGILQSYDKVHLVPFGEYLPFDQILRQWGLRNLIHIPGGFTAGRERGLLNIKGLPPTAPLICYEAIFSGEVVPPSTPSASRKRPGLFLNVTDDSWYGLTSGPYQHFSQARLRAIEEGLPLLRAANNGISAIIDSYGRIMAMLPLGAVGVLDGPLPEALDQPPIFARFPFIAPFLIWLTTFTVPFILSSKPEIRN